MNQNQDRGIWSSKIGFIMAAAGSAVGLGNIWRFPYMTGMHGGAAFVLIYLFFVLMLGLPIMLNELVVGRRTNLNPVGALETLRPGTQWKLVGGLGVLTGFGILSFYSVIAGWTVGYIYKSIIWGWIEPVPQDQLAQVFQDFTESPVNSIGLLLVFMALTMAVVYRGVKDGIERWSKILMPILLGVLVLLIIRGVTLPNAEVGIKFYLKPDFSKITGEILIEALGQAFFSLSLGMGAMITYGSYLSKNDNLVTSGISVCLFDTLIALLAGMAILPAVFALGQEPTQGPNLIFVVLPAIFMKMPAGSILGPLFFFLLTIAALTSTVSLLEVVTAYFVDEKGWKRQKAVIIVGSICAVFSALAALSFGISDGLSNLPIINMGFFDILDMLFAKYSLTIGALLLAVFVGWRWGIKNATDEVTSGNAGFRGIGSTVWGLIIRFLAPLLIILLIIDSLKLDENYKLIAGILGYVLIEGFVVWFGTKFIAKIPATLHRTLLLPIVRLLFLVILGPVLLLIPFAGWGLVAILAIGLYYILLYLILDVPQNKIFIPLGVITILEIIVFAGYKFL